MFEAEEIASSRGLRALKSCNNFACHLGKSVLPLMGSVYNGGYMLSSVAVVHKRW